MQMFILKLQWGNEISFPGNPIKKKKTTQKGLSSEDQVPVLKFYLLIKILKSSYNYQL